MTNLQVVGVASRLARYKATKEEIERAMPRLLSVWPAHDTCLQRTGIRYVFVFEPVPVVAEPG